MIYLNADTETPVDPDEPVKDTGAGDHPIKPPKKP
jgi:hypothetical protein